MSQSKLEHFGPKARIPDLFQRRDQIYFALETQQLQWYTPAPLYHHDLLDAAAKVGHIEELIGYVFKEKMTCIEALKVSSHSTPLYFKGVVHTVAGNKRLALLGDRVLGLALTEIWFHTGRSAGLTWQIVEYSAMSLNTETRAALHARGRALGIHSHLLLSIASSGPSLAHVAETFEAILGAVYLDSGHRLQVVKDVMRRIELDD
ncbi:ribonuclease III, partial [Clathrospora elynae]